MTRASKSKTRRPPRSRRPPAPARRSTTPLIFGGLAIVIIAVALASFALAPFGTSGPAEPATRTITVQGEHLRELTDPAADAAVGQPIPSLSGVGLDGQPIEIGPDDGPMAIVVLAHWCPHCQAELPGIAGFMAAGAGPDGVSVMGVSTAIDAVRPNYPPSAWMEREGWNQPTLIDDSANSALHALGLGNFPGFVFVAADGTVVQRMTGEIGVDRFAEMLAALAP